ncbi:MAG TPA: dynamin family protein [Vicinamibacterales bacterium]|nr:dynamin family protein [Vicinamibacterales bacterium]
MLSRLLEDRTRQYLADEREWLGRLQLVLARFDVSAEDKSALERSIAQLDRLFLLVVIGEFNAGKSAFVNALAGALILEEGVTPTTTTLQILQFGETRARTTDRTGAAIITAPVPLLQDLNIVDTPGTNAIFREHERLTSEFVPQADLVLFVTSADRPFTESERAFLHEIKKWGKKIVIVINKIDLLERDDERQQVVAFVADHARTLIGTTPEIFPVSARRALRRKVAAADASTATESEGVLTGDVASAKSEAPATPVRPAGEAPIAGDRFDDLERYISSTLDEKERVRLKLLNPIGIGLRLVQTSRATIGDRTEVLRADLQTIEDIERQLDVYRTDLSREFEFRLAEVDNILQQFENRGTVFFDDTLRVGRIPDLLNRARIQREFERAVVADVPQQIEQQVHDLIDWMVSSELRQWQTVTEHVNRRARAHEGRLLGGESSGFQYDRKKLIATVGHAANQAVDSYDREREAAAMADGVRTAVAGAALAQAGAIGLGAMVATLATTTAADVTGIVAAGTIAVLGMFVIPSKRKHAKGQLRDRIERMRVELMTGLRSQFQKEVDRSVRGVMDAVAPYTRFVRAESSKLTSMDRELEEIGAHLTQLRAEIQRAP